LCIAMLKAALRCAALRCAARLFAASQERARDWELSHLE